MVTLKFSACMIAIALGCSQSYAADNRESYFKSSIQVSATTPWVDTGIDIPSDKTFYLVADGMVAWASNAYASPKGVGYYLNKQELLLPGGTPYSLICRIGSEKPFYVGDFMSGMVTLRSPGRLYCGINEANGSITN